MTDEEKMEFLKELPLGQLRKVLSVQIKSATTFNKLASLCYTGWLITQSKANDEKELLKASVPEHVLNGTLPNGDD